MPGLHVTDQQTRLFMTLRQTHSTPVAAAKTGISQATGYRLQADPSLPSQKKAPRGQRRPDPLADIFNTKVAPRPDEYAWTGTPPTVPDGEGNYPIARPGSTKPY